MTRTIEYIPIEDLKENPRNVKDHESRQSRPLFHGSV